MTSVSQRLVKLWPSERSSLAEPLVLVELAVLRRPDAAVLVRERLMPVHDVDDAEPTDADRDPRGDMGSDVVRPAMPDDLGHPVEHVKRDHLGGTHRRAEPPHKSRTRVSLYGRIRVLHPPRFRRREERLMSYVVPPDRPRPPRLRRAARRRVMPWFRGDATGDRVGEISWLHQDAVRGRVRRASQLPGPDGHRRPRRSVRGAARRSAVGLR